MTSDGGGQTCTNRCRPSVLVSRLRKIKKVKDNMTKDTVTHPEHQHRNPAASANLVMARIPNFNDTFVKESIEKISSKKPDIQ